MFYQICLVQCSCTVCAWNALWDFWSKLGFHSNCTLYCNCMTVFCLCNCSLLSLWDDMINTFLVLLSSSLFLRPLQGLSDISSLQCNRPEPGLAENVFESLKYQSKLGYIRTRRISNWWNLFSPGEFSQRDRLWKKQLSASVQYLHSSNSHIFFQIWEIKYHLASFIFL